MSEFPDDFDTVLAEVAPAPIEPEPKPKANGHAGGTTNPIGPLGLTEEQFDAGLAPPDYLIDGILQRGYLYSITARTNHGKTAVAMLIMHHIDHGKPLHGKEVSGGNVLYLAGENADNIRARNIAQRDYFRAERTGRVYFVAGVINIAERMADLQALAVQVGGFALVVVDTAAAFFPGDDINSNSQQGAYARLLRELTLLFGKPCVLVCAHPIKNAARDNLLPMGGSAFLNEVDGNLTLWANGEKQLSLHWLGKFRGPEFEPLAFELVRVETSNVVDAKGRLMPSVVAVPIAEEALVKGEARAETDENRVMFALGESPKASFTFLASKCGFANPAGQPDKLKVQRVMERLLQDKFVSRYRGGKYALTEKGRKDVGIDADDDA